MTDIIDPAADDRRFEIALRLFGKEVFAIALFSSSPSAKWLWMSLGSVLTLTVIVIVYGSNLSAFYHSLLSS